MKTLGHDKTSVDLVVYCHDGLKFVTGIVGTNGYDNYGFVYLHICLSRYRFTFIVLLQNHGTDLLLSFFNFVFVLVYSIFLDRMYILS